MEQHGHHITIQSPSNKPRPLNTPVLEVFDSVDTNDPMFGGVSFFQDVQLEILVSYLSISHPVVPTGLTCGTVT